MGDHDGLFKLGFGEPLHAAGELRSVLPAAIVEAVRLEELERVDGSFVDEALAQRHTDLLFRAPRRDGGEPLYLYFLIEHQSEPDRWMALRVLVYAGLLWQCLAREASTASSGAGRRLPSGVGGREGPRHTPRQGDRTTESLAPSILAG